MSELIIFKLKLRTLTPIPSFFTGFLLENYYRSIFLDILGISEGRKDLIDVAEDTDVKKISGGYGWSIKPIYIVKKKRTPVENRVVEERVYFINKPIPKNYSVFSELVLYSDRLKRYWYEIMNRLLSGRIQIGVRGRLIRLEVGWVKMDEVEPTSLKGDRFKLYFKTPTILKRNGDNYILFPDPDILIKNLNEACKDVLDDDSADSLNKQVYITAYELSMSPAYNPFTNSIVKGFIGWCVVEAEDKDSMAKMARLLSLSEYVNLGSFRHLGFGVIEANSLISSPQ